MNILLAAKVRKFLKQAEPEAKKIVEDLLEEMKAIEQKFRNIETKLKEKNDEIAEEKWYWEQKFFELFHGDSDEK